MDTVVLKVWESSFLVSEPTLGKTSETGVTDTSLISLFDWVEKVTPNLGKGE